MKAKSKISDFKIEMMPLDKIIPYARNPRRNASAIDKVAASLKEYGPKQPIVVDKDRVIIVGHTRLLAAKKLGLKTFPVHIATNLTPAQAKAYRLMDNRSHKDSEWDMELLPLELADLKNLNFDLDLTGFDENELSGFLGSFSPGGLKDQSQLDEKSKIKCPECGYEFLPR